MITTHFGNILVGNAFGNRGSVPANYFVALSTTTPTTAGTNFTEPTLGSGYTRVAVPNTESEFSLPSNMRCNNLNAIEFPISTASWGIITHVGLFDSETGGNLLDFEALASSRTIDPDTQLTIGAGDMILEFGNCS